MSGFTKRGMMSMVAAAAIAAAILIPSISKADWPLDLVDDPANPIFIPPSGDRVYYQSVLYDVDGFGDGGAGPFYRMWFSDGSGIGTATSVDGIDWSEGADCDGLTNPHHSKVLYDADGFGAGAGAPPYRIWYWDTANLYSVDAIRTAHSSDGISWTDDQAISQDVAMPLVSGGANDWNRGSYGPVDVIYNASATNSGDDPFGYSYTMYYDGTTGGFEQIGLGYSADGLHWTRYGDDPVLPCGVDWTVSGNWGAPTPWDSSYASYGSVVVDDEGLYHLFYSGGTTAVHQGIGHATSYDGIDWTKDSGNPYISLVPDTWHSQRAYTPSVIYEPNRYSGHGDNSKFKMWYSGRDDDGIYMLGYQGSMIGRVTVSAGTLASDPTCMEEGGDYIVPLLQIIADVDATEAITIDGILSKISGTAVDQSAIRSVLLYDDLNPDGIIDADEELIAEVDLEDGAADFAPIDVFAAASSSRFLLVAVRVSQTADGELEVQAGIWDSADVEGYGETSGQLIVEMDSPMEGAPYALSVCSETPPTPGPDPDPEPTPVDPGDSMQGGCECTIGAGAHGGTTAAIAQIFILGSILCRRIRFGRRSRRAGEAKRPSRRRADRP